MTPFSWVLGTGYWVLGTALIMALHTFPVVPVPVTHDTGSGVDASVDLVLDEVISPVRLVTIRAVTALQGRC